MNYGACLGPRSTQGGESGGVHSFTWTLGVLIPLAMGGVGCGKGTGSAEASGRPGKAMRHPEGFQAVKGPIFLEPQMGQALGTYWRTRPT